MVGYLRKATNRDADFVGRKALSDREEMWGPIDGEVKSYDASTGTATIQPLYKPIQNGQPVDMPELYEVPIEMPRTASAGLTFPIPAGTKVRLTPNMRSMENYDTENDGSPSDGRSFSLADMRATLIGGDSLSEPMKGVDSENTHLRFDAEGKFGMKGSPDGKVRIDGAQGNIYELIADAVDECQKGFDKLKDEPALIYTGDYGAAAAALASILGKLRGMAL
jgi:hypothetical protein